MVFLNQIIKDDMIDSIYTKAVDDMNFCGQTISCQYTYINRRILVEVCLKQK